MSKRSRVELPLNGPLDLDAVLSMGQTFAWRRSDAWHLAAIDGVLLRVRVAEGHLIAEGSVSEARLGSLVARYFDTARDLPALQRELSADPHVRDAIARHPGLRILQQPFWETLAAFILSTVNNIPRITRTIARLSEAFGEPCRLLDVSGYAFPKPGRLVDLPPATLYDCGTGFRAKALQEAARAVMNGSLDEARLRQMPFAKARARLMELYGVGEKVADCVLLYSLGRFEAFPLDVWMRRQMEALYFGGAHVSLRAMQAFAKERFGPWAGVAQLYLYHDARQRT